MYGKYKTCLIFTNKIENCVKFRTLLNFSNLRKFRVPKYSKLSENFQNVEKSYFKKILKFFKI